MIIFIIYLIGLVLSALLLSVWYHSQDGECEEDLLPLDLPFLLGIFCLMWPLGVLVVISWYGFIVPISFVGKQIAHQLKKTKEIV